MFVHHPSVSDRASPELSSVFWSSQDSGSLKSNSLNEDCQTSKGNPDTWTLVSRTKSLKEVWRDDAGRTLWGDINEAADHDRAKESCSEETNEANGELANMNFHLPRAAEYSNAT